MKLIHIVDNLEVGGAQTMLLTLLTGLTARGYQQHVICLNENFAPRIVNSVQETGSTVEIIGRPRLFTLVGVGRIVAELRRRRPDVVHTVMPWGDLVGRTTARMAGVRPIVSTVTARYIDKPRLQLLLDRATVRWADRVVFVSAEVVPFSIAREGVRRDQVHCIPNGVDIDDRDRTAAAAQLRGRFGDGATTIIGMVARLHPQKAHDELIEAFAQLRPGRDVRLWLVGDGPERARLEALVRRRDLQDHVIFAGDRADVFDWLTAMDLFVHPTHFEGLPVAVIEAMSLGKPVIATAVDGLRELVQPNVDGWLVPDRNIEALAERLRFAIDNPAEAARVGRAAAKRVRAEFNGERVVQSYDVLFRSLVCEPSQHPASLPQ